MLKKSLFLCTLLTSLSNTPLYSFAPFRRVTLFAPQYVRAISSKKTRQIAYQKAKKEASQKAKEYAALMANCLAKNPEDRNHYYRAHLAGELKYHDTLLRRGVLNNKPVCAKTIIQAVSLRNAKVKKFLRDN